MPERDPDSVLLEAVARHRDKDAFTALMRRYERDLFKLANFLTRNAASAEEAVQDAMLQVWRRASQFEHRGEGSVRSWLLRVTANESIRIARSRARADRRTERAAERRPEPEQRSPDDSAEQRELLGALRRKMGELPDAERELVALYYGVGLNQKSVAEALNLSQQVVSYRLKAVLDRLREDLLKAGFAAALPLFDLPGLGLDGVLSEPAEVPAGLADRAASLLSRESARSGRAAARGSLAPYGIAAALVLAIGAGGWLLSARDPAAGATTPAPAVRPAAPTEDAPHEETFQRRWDFNDGKAHPDGLVLGDGIVLEPAGGPDGSACLKSNSARAEILLKFDPMPKLPLRIRFRQRLVGLPGKETGFVLPGWTDTSLKVFSIFRNLGVIFDVDAKATPWCTSECYISEHFLDQWLDGKRTNLNYVELRAQRGLLISIRGQFLIDDLEINAIEPQQTPDLAAFREAIATIPPESRVAGTYALPQLPSPYPGKTVRLEFLRCRSEAQAPEAKDGERP